MPVYVDSNATGANNGTSWTDAFVALDSALSGIAAGTEIWAEKNHYEQFTANKKFNFGNHFANPPRLLCVDKSDDSLSTGAELEALNGTNLINISLHGSFYIDGVKFTSWAQPDFDELGGETAAPNTQWCKRCTFAVNFTGADTSEVRLQFGDNYRGDFRVLEDCTFDFSGMTGKRCRIFAWAGNNRIVNPTLVNGTWFSIERAGFEGSCKIVIENADLSAATAALFTQVSSSDQGVCEAILRRCKVPATVSATIVRPGNTLLLDNCDDGTISVPALVNGLYDYRGTVLTTLSRYRTGGADDGEQANAHSWEMAANANAVEIYGALASPPLARWVDPDASISGATAKGIFTSTRCDPLATPTNLTTDGDSTWNGTGVGTKQKITHTLTNGSTLTVYVASGGTLNNDDFWIEVSEPDQVGGPVSVRAFLAKPSTTVYVRSSRASRRAPAGRGRRASAPRFRT
jgi:hypothetical protein